MFYSEDLFLGGGEGCWKRKDAAALRGTASLQSVGKLDQRAGDQTADERTSHRRSASSGRSGGLQAAQAYCPEFRELQEGEKLNQIWFLSVLISENKQFS